MSANDPRPIEIRLKRKPTRPASGVRITVGLAPSMFPRSITAVYERAVGELVFRFNYINDEPASRKQREFERLRFVEGRHSGKLLEVRVCVDGPSDVVDAVQMSIRAVQELDLSLQGTEAARNHRQAIDALSDLSREIQRSVACS